MPIIPTRLPGSLEARNLDQDDDCGHVGRWVTDRRLTRSASWQDLGTPLPRSSLCHCPAVAYKKRHCNIASASGIKAAALLPPSWPIGHMGHTALSNFMGLVEWLGMDILVIVLYAMTRGSIPHHLPDASHCLSPPPRCLPLPLTTSQMPPTASHHLPDPSCCLPHQQHNMPCISTACSVNSPGYFPPYKPCQSTVAISGTHWEVWMLLSIHCHCIP